MEEKFQDRLREPRQSNVAVMHIRLGDVLDAPGPRSIPLEQYLEAPVDYYSLASASYGLQIGAQQYSNIIFFMTEEALQTFRVKDGWELGADAEVVFKDKGYSIGVSSKTISKPVYAIVFDQKGLLAGTSLVGAKFSRLIR